MTAEPSGNDESVSAAAARKRRCEKMRRNPENVPRVVKSNVPLPCEMKSVEAEINVMLPPKKRKFSCDLSIETDCRKVNKSTSDQVPMCSPDSSANNNPIFCGSGKVKQQQRYNPEVPMSKEEVSAWRREARKVRNRESAAASRRKTRDRIQELEIEVSEWKAKYEALLKQVEDKTRTQQQNEDVHFNSSASVVSRNDDSSESSGLSGNEAQDPQYDAKREMSVVNGRQHPIETILKPAVKISGAVTSIPLSISPSAKTVSSELSFPTDAMPASVISLSSLNRSQCKHATMTNDDDDLVEFLQVLVEDPSCSTQISMK